VGSQWQLRWLLSLPSSSPLSCSALAKLLQMLQGRNQPRLVTLTGFFLFLLGSINHRPEAALIQTGTGSAWHCILQGSDVCFPSQSSSPAIIRQKCGCSGHDAHRLHHTAPHRHRTVPGVSPTCSAARGRGCWLCNGCAITEKCRCPHHINTSTAPAGLTFIRATTPKNKCFHEEKLVKTKCVINL